MTSHLDEHSISIVSWSFFWLSVPDKKGVYSKPKKATCWSQLFKVQDKENQLFSLLCFIPVNPPLFPFFLFLVPSGPWSLTVLLRLARNSWGQESPLPGSGTIGTHDPTQLSSLSLSSFPLKNHFSFIKQNSSTQVFIKCKRAWHYSRLWT